MRRVDPVPTYRAEAPLQQPVIRALHAPACADSRGFTVLEVLAALLMVAITLLGIAALYTEGARAGGGIESKQLARELAENIAERIRANAAGRLGYASVVGVVCDANSRLRRPDDLAAREAACWHDQVEARLPSGMGSITRDVTTTPPTYVIAVSWSAPAEGTASYVIRTQPESEAEG